MALDPVLIARTDKSKPLAIETCKRETTCCLCDGPMSVDEWCVHLFGKEAHTHCAGGHGWDCK